MPLTTRATFCPSDHKHRLTFWLGLASLTIASECQGSHTDNLAELPLEELLSFSVSTASKLPSTIVDSPGVISVYSADEIALFGGRDLGDILARIPGINPYPAAPGNGYRITGRTDAPRLNNNHLLFLLNGIPFNRESYSGGLWNHTTMTTFPIAAIRQIEVVRGPGSVLYGTNAYSGVINIITKRADELDDSLRIGAGTNGVRAADMAVGAESDSHDSEAITALRYYKTDGATLHANDDSGAFRTHLEETTPGALISARHKGFHATFHWGHADMEDIRGSQAQWMEGEVDNERLFADLGYDYRINDQWLGKVDVSHASARTDLMDPTVSTLGPIHYKTDDSRVELQLQGRINDNLELVTGLTYDSLYARVDEPYPFLPHWRQYLYGGYAQATYRWHDTSLIGGLQFNKAEGIPGNTVPRLGIIHHLNENMGAKLMYAEAYRAPYALEKNVSIVTPTISLVGNPKLDHETVKTWDLQFFYNTHHFQSALTLFHTRQEDLIVREMRSPGVISFFNSDELDTDGIELEGKYIPDSNWYLSGSATWQRNEDKSGTDDTTLQPDYVVKVGAGYQADTWSLAVFDNYRSSYQDNVVVTPNRSELNPGSEAFHDISLNGTLKVPKVPSLTLELYVNNLLDEDFWLPAIPGFTTSTVNTLPSVESGRTILVTAELLL